MTRMHKTSLKTTLLAAIACAALSTPSFAQVYQNDYTSLHFDPNKRQWVTQDAIYADKSEEVYYIAQQLRPVNSKQAYLGITKCNRDMKVISTWEYFNRSGKMRIETKNIDEMYGLGALILVGHYSNQDNISEPFVMSVDKASGAINWFKWFPGLELTSLDADEDFVIVTGSRALPNNDGIYPYSASAALIMRLDKKGNLEWEREFEDDKYASSGYGPKFVYNTMNDVTRINEKYFAAVGTTNRWVYKEKPENLWDADGMVVMIDLDGNIKYNYLFGNALPMDPNGQQPIQYEQMDHITYDATEGTVVITGERLDNEQRKLSEASPAPEAWGLWVTKFDPLAPSVVWSYRYTTNERPYHVSDPEITDDQLGQYGIGYNYGKANTIAMKLDNQGFPIYHRQHFVSGFNSDDRVLNDITWSMEYNNITLVGSVIPNAPDFNSSYGWNIQAFDQIREKCEMYEQEVKQEVIKFDVDKVGNREYKVEVKEEAIRQDKYALDNKVICGKNQVWFKSTPTTRETSMDVTQDMEGHSVTVQMHEGMNGTATMPYKATLYNALGQKMMESDNFTISQKMDISGLTPGVYYLQVWNSSFKQAHTVLVK